MNIFLLTRAVCLCAALVAVPAYAVAQGMSDTYMCARGKENVTGFRFHPNGVVSVLDGSGKLIAPLRYQVKDKLITIFGPHADMQLPMLANGNLEFRESTQSVLICKK